MLSKVDKAKDGLFKNVDPDTGMPILDRAKLDAIIKKHGDSIRGNGNARMSFDDFGWGMVSDNGQILHGPAIVGLYMANVPDPSK